MKIVYLNDTLVPVTIRVIHGNGDNEYFTQVPGQARTYVIKNCPADSIPYVKEWSNCIVLLSCISESLIGNIESSDNMKDTSDV